MINGASPGSRKDFQTKETAVTRQEKGDSSVKQAALIKSTC